MDRIRRCARASILKALAFASFGIGTVMMGLGFDLALALEAGGCLTALAACVLALKGLHAPRQPYRSAEAWLLLGRRHGLRLIA